MEKTGKMVEQKEDGYFSLFDEQFTISDFSQAINSAGEKADDTLSAAKRAVKKALLKDEEVQYVVDIDPELQNKFDRGEVELVYEKGEMLAQIRRPDGKYGKKLAIKEELKEEGLSSQAVQMAIQMEAIKKQLQVVIEKIVEIEDRILDVAQGQRNDRVGLFYSGLSIYIESKSIEDVFLRKQLVSQAIKTISDANFQMIQDIRQSVSYLVNEQYKSSKKMTAKISEHLSIIRQCYEVVYRASFLKAMIYYDSGEISAMLSAIDEYGKFIEKMVVPYAGKLSELDITSKFIEKGTWGQIAKTLTGCKELQAQIGKTTKYVFSLSEGEEDNVEA